MASVPLAWHATKRIPPAFWITSLAGWIAHVSVTAASTSLGDLCISAVSPGAEFDVQLVRLGTTWPSLLLASSLMLLAMMPPLMVGALLHVWRRSLAKRRIRAVLLFVTGYAIAWLPVWLLVSQFSMAAMGTTSQPGWYTFLLLCTLALAWQATPLKQTCLNACHRRPPLSTFGPRAELDAAAFGLRQGCACIGNCWALMLVPLAATGALHMGLMACATLLLLQERTRAPETPIWGAALSAWPHRNRSLKAELRA